MAYDFKKINELELVNGVPEGANVLIETEGTTKRLPSTAINNGYSKEEVYTKAESDEKYVAKEDVVQSDLAQNDPSAADYVKNRTHWVEMGTVIEEQTIEGLAVMQDPIYVVQNPFIFSPIAGNRYIVHWDGIAYGVEAQSLDGCLCLGNENYLTMNTGGDIPFAILVFEDGNIYIATESTANSHTICIEGEVVHKLDKKFLPDDVGGLFKVNISYDEANSQWVSDKTYNEIKAAEEAKMPIIGTFTHMYGNVYTLMGCDATMRLACRLSAFDVSHMEAPIIYSIVVHEDGDVLVSELTLAATASEIPPAEPQ